MEQQLEGGQTEPKDHLRDGGNVRYVLGGRIHRSKTVKMGLARGSYEVEIRGRGEKFVRYKFRASRNSTNPTELDRSRRARPDSDIVPEMRIRRGRGSKCHFGFSDEVLQSSDYKLSKVERKGKSEGR